MKQQFKKNSGSKILQLSADLLLQIDKGINLDYAVERIRGNEYGRTISDILFNYYRNKRKLDYIIAKFAERGKKKTPEKFKRILKVAVTQYFFQTGIEKEKAIDIAVGTVKKKYGSAPSGFLNAVLRNISRVSFEEHLADADFKINIPENVFRRWEKNLSDDQLKKIDDLVTDKPELTFRLTSDISSEELEKNLCHKISLPDWSGDMIFYAAEDSSVLFEKNWVQEGKIYIQDPATAASCMMYKPSSGDIILDLCSAPGGKTVILAENSKDKGVVISSDLSIARQQKTKENILKHRLTNCHIISASAMNPPFSANFADLVFLDVPCTNTGVFRRRPDVLWNFNEKKLKELVALQKKILDKSSELVKPGGKLIYSTCSIEIEENSKQIENFLKMNTEFDLIKELQLFPSKIHDGAYAALLQKNNV